MKKLFSLLLAGTFSATLFTGCGSQKFSPLPLQQNIVKPRQNVSSLSAKGLGNFHNFIIETTFKTLDKNTDRFLTLQEYTSMYNGSLAPAMPASVLPAENQGIVAAASTTEDSIDAFDRFRDMDANKDYKLSLTEVRNQDNFLPFDKKLFRGIAAVGFAFLDKDKNKSINKEEFAFQVGSDQALQLANSTIFYNGDRNFDSKLSFSEYEDILYSMVIARANTPQVPTDPAQPPAEPPSGPIPF